MESPQGKNQGPFDDIIPYLEPEEQEIFREENSEAWRHRDLKESESCPSPNEVSSVSSKFEEKDIQDQFNLGDFDMRKLKIGRKQGRPRKWPKKSKAFEIREKNKILRFLRHSEKILLKTLKTSSELQIISFQDPMVPTKEGKPDLADQIMEVGEMLGLIALEERDKARDIVSKSL